MCAGRPWTGASLQEVAEDMFNNGTLLVEGVDSPPGDACHPKPDWDGPLRCYSPAMFNAEASPFLHLFYLLLLAACMYLHDSVGD